MFLLKTNARMAGNGLKRGLLVAAAASGLAMAPVAANAMLVDFTDETQFDTGSTSHTYTSFDGGSLDVSISSDGGALSFTNFDGDNSVADLAFDNDGVGVGDDEITNGSESVTVTFSKVVQIVAFHFLDLFGAPSGPDEEVAEVYKNGMLVASFSADVLFSGLGGYKYEEVMPSIFGDTLVFKAAPGNDNQGQADYALAALEVVPVPLPASALLFGSGVFGLGLLARRRKSKAGSVTVNAA